MRETGNFADQRRVDNLLIEYLRSFQIAIANAAGEPFVGVVRYYECEKAVATEISLEKFAAYLAHELVS
jgi:hypothetical protein